MTAPGLENVFFPHQRVDGVPVTAAEIRRIVSECFDLPPDALTSATRLRAVAWPRQMAMALAYRFTGLSLPQIGRAFGGRDHTTVLHAVRAVDRRRADIPTYDALMLRLEARVAAARPDFVRRDLARGVFRTRRAPVFRSSRSEGART